MSKATTPPKKTKRGKTVATPAAIVKRGRKPRKKDLFG